MRAAPKPPVSSAFARGGRTVSRAAADTGLSRQELWALMNAGTVRWFPHGGRRTRLLSWGDLTDYLDGLHAEYAAHGAAK